MMISRYCDFFTLILQGKGYLTDTAETGKEALEKISNQPYDVITRARICSELYRVNRVTYFDGEAFWLGL